jgi:dihydrofolate synthase/folylpolyglutamate synthase
MDINNFLNSLINYEKFPSYDYTLAAYRRFLARIGSPQDKLGNIILIAGTKGKGSTAAILNSCLIAAGYRVGLYTSPHLKKVNERIQINGRPIIDREFEKYIRIIKPYIDYNRREGARTFFEVLTAIAFLHFLEYRVDIALVEVGLGGRRDATNVTRPLISVITRIGYDHENLLGKKLSGIAYEKAGIIHDRGTTVTIHQRPIVGKILRAEVRKRRQRMVFAESLHDLKITRSTLAGTAYRVTGKLGKFDLFLPLAGAHQRENLALALAVLSELKDRGFKVTVPKIVRGLRRTELAGRFETLSRDPLVIYDAAHNEDSFRALEKNLAFLRGKKLYLIFGCSSDKDIGYCLRHIFPRGRRILLVKADHPRALDPAEILNRAKRFKNRMIVAGTVPKALEYFRSVRDENKAAVIFGSFYLYSQI